ncbi:MAG TPA: LanC-like protein [Solirubrobacteraceae bacterium]|nr:LanC-like protein [Solirubrobacteraceae bacterium]
MLYDPDEHRPLQGRPWSESEARAAIEVIARDAIEAYQGPERLWPNAAEDLEGDPDVPYRNAYFGAAGVAWTLDRLARDGLAPPFARAPELAETLHEGFLAAPELTALNPPVAASFFFGESGILLAAEAILRDETGLSALEACVRRNTGHPSLELCWGSPGTMTAALAMWRASGDKRWSDAWIASAERLISEWREPVWIQDLYGTRQRYVGAGHGFAGNAFALLSGADLLGEQAERVTDRIRRTLIQLAQVEGDLAQWFPLVGADSSRHPVQWCHGAPGMVISLVGLPRDGETDRLLDAGGELTWQAGPLRKGPGLCHGTAGNAYAFLALFARSGDEIWLERAQAFAMDAAADAERSRDARGFGRYSLYTGDLGVAMLLRGCLNANAAFPFLEDALGTQLR